MTEQEAGVVYEFGGFRLDGGNHACLSRTVTAGRLRFSGAAVEPVFLLSHTLHYFVERRGQLLDKATLMKAIWPNLVVEENSLNQNISMLRRVLGEGPSEHRFIVTVPGRGYRFVAEVRRVSNSPALTKDAKTPPPAEPVTQAAAPTASIAVLPFANLTRDPEKEYFGDGMAEELISTCWRAFGA